MGSPLASVRIIKEQDYIMSEGRTRFVGHRFIVESVCYDIAPAVLPFETHAPRRILNMSACLLTGQVTLRGA